MKIVLPLPSQVVLAAWADRLALAVRMGIGLVFAVAGVFKLATLPDFARIIGDYGILPQALHLPTALGLALAEAAAGLGLVLGRRRCLEAVAALLVLFMAVLTYGMALGLDADCGCFGPSDPETTYHGGMGLALTRDAAMLTGCLFLYLRRRADSARQPADTLQPSNPGVTA